MKELRRVKVFTGENEARAYQKYLRYFLNYSYPLHSS